MRREFGSLAGVRAVSHAGRDREGKRFLHGHALKPAEAAFLAEGVPCTTML